MIFIAHHLLALLVLLCLSLLSGVSAHMQKKHASRGFWERYQYLHAHNSVRAQHGAQDLTWSDALADAAESWVQSCQFSHSSGLLDDGTPYGENMVAGAGTVSISAAVQAFASDESSFTSDPPVYNHFSQVVWKNTTEVGCARQKGCSNILDTEATLVACLYSPPGNVVGSLAENVQL